MMVDSEHCSYRRGSRQAQVCMLTQNELLHKSTSTTSVKRIPMLKELHSALNFLCLRELQQFPSLRQKCDKRNYTIQLPIGGAPSASPHGYHLCLAMQHCSKSFNIHPSQNTLQVNAHKPTFNIYIIYIYACMHANPSVYIHVLSLQSGNHTMPKQRASPDSERETGNASAAVCITLVQMLVPKCKDLGLPRYHTGNWERARPIHEFLQNRIPAACQQHMNSIVSSAQHWA